MDRSPKYPSMRHLPCRHRACPVLHRGELTKEELEREPAGESVFGVTREGYVVRTAAAFPHEEFERAMAKCVRENHVQTNEHWKRGPIKMNALAER